MDPSSFASWVFSEMRITGSTLTPDDEADTAVLIGGEASAAELEDGTPAYGTLGLVFRPRPPEPVRPSDVAGLTPLQRARLINSGDIEVEHATAIAVRHAERLVPVAYRDPRLNRVYQPPEGALALVAYGGGVLSFEDAPITMPDGSIYLTSRATLHVPRGDGEGVMQFEMDPVEETFTLRNGQSTVVIDRDGKLTCSAPVIHVDSDDIRLAEGAKQIACVGDLVAVTCAPCLAGTAPVIPVTAPPGVTEAVAIPGVGQIISGRSKVKA